MTMVLHDYSHPRALTVSDDTKFVGVVAFFVTQQHVQLRHTCFCCRRQSVDQAFVGLTKVIFIDIY